MKKFLSLIILGASTLTLTGCLKSCKHAKEVSGGTTEEQKAGEGVVERSSMMDAKALDAQPTSPSLEATTYADVLNEEHIRAPEAPEASATAVTNESSAVSSIPTFEEFSKSMAQPTTAAFDQTAPEAAYTV